MPAGWSSHEAIRQGPSPSASKAPALSNDRRPLGFRRGVAVSLGNKPGTAAVDEASRSGGDAFPDPIRDAALSARAGRLGAGSPAPFRSLAVRHLRGLNRDGMGTLLHRGRIFTAWD